MHVKDLTVADEKDIERRLSYAGIWIEKFAPEGVKLRIIENIDSIKISDGQKKAMLELGKFLESKRSDDEIMDEIRGISKRSNIKTQEIFQAAYMLLFGKPHGPQLAPLLQTIDKKLVVNRFKMKK